MAESAPQTGTDTPPTYDSLFGRLKQMKEESSNPITFTTKLCSVLTGSALFTVTLACAAAIPLVSLIIGAVYINDCPKQKYIPIWLIVVGTFGCVSALISASAKTYEYVKKRRNPEYKMEKKIHIKSLIDIFLFAWAICGSVWVYQIWTEVSYDPTSVNYCQKTCYLFAFSILTISWCLAGLVCLCCICCIPLFLIIGCITAAN